MNQGRTTLIVGAALLVGATFAVGYADKGTISLPVLNCYAIRDMAERDGVLDGDGDQDACVKEGERQSLADQRAIAEALFGG